MTDRVCCVNNIYKCNFFVLQYREPYTTLWTSHPTQLPVSLSPTNTSFRHFINAIVTALWIPSAYRASLFACLKTLGLVVLGSYVRFMGQYCWEILLGARAEAYGGPWCISWYGIHRLKRTGTSFFDAVYIHGPLAFFFKNLVGGLSFETRPTPQFFRNLVRGHFWGSP